MLDFFHLLSVMVVFSFPYSKGFCSYNFGYFFETLYMAALSGLHCPIDIKDGSVRKKVLWVSSFFAFIIFHFSDHKNVLFFIHLYNLVL